MFFRNLRGCGSLGLAQHSMFCCIERADRLQRLGLPPGTCLCLEARTKTPSAGWLTDCDCRGWGPTHIWWFTCTNDGRVRCCELCGNRVAACGRCLGVAVVMGLRIMRTADWNPVFHGCTNTARTHGMLCAELGKGRHSGQCMHVICMSLAPAW